MVVGILVCYKPDLDLFILNTKKNAQDLDYLILIENGSNNNTQNRIKSEFTDSKFIVILLDKNLGLAKAQNIGIKKGIELNAEYFLFLDDDSILEVGSVERLKEELIQNPKVGIAACHIIHENSNKVQKYWIKNNFFFKRVELTKSNHKLENVNTVISSGSLISKSVIERCGLMLDNYFIDYIDIEYCLRVKKKGYTIVVLRDAVLYHNLGNTRTVTLGNFEFHPTNHSSERRYYMIRNRIWTWKKYCFTFPGWLLIDFGNFLVDNTRMFILEKNRLKNLKFFSLGLIDGIFKSSGQANQY